MDDSCEHIEYEVADSRQGVVLQLGKMNDYGNEVTMAFSEFIFLRSSMKISQFLENLLGR
jgi:hypothetical protein